MCSFVPKHDELSVNKKSRGHGLYFPVTVGINYASRLRLKKYLHVLAFFFFLTNVGVCIL